MIVTSLYDVTRLSCAMGEGSIKGEHNGAWGLWLLLLLSSGCFDTSVRVSTEPQTLYLSCLSASQVGSISQMYRVVCFYHKHASRPMWRTLSYYDFIYLMVTRQTTTFSLRTWYWVKHRSQPFGGKMQGWDKSLAWCESLPVYLVYLCHPTKCGPVTFLASLGGLHTLAPFFQEENPRSGSAVGAVTESWPFLKLLSLVVLGGKWLPFSPAGGIPTFVKEPCWWCINGFPHDVTRKQLPQTK